MRRCLGTLVIALLVWWGCSKDKPLDPSKETPPKPDPVAEAPGLWVGPVQGLTTTWHPAPPKFAVTNDVGTLQLKLVATEVDADIEWNGAVEISREDNISIAEVTLPSAGSNQRVEVKSTIVADGAQEVSTFSAGILVANRSAADVQLGAIVVSQGEPSLDQYTTPWARMRLLLDGRSIATVTGIGNGAYRTASNSLVHVKTTSNELGLLLEWRVNGVATLLGTEGDIVLPERAGKQVISVGPVAHSQVSRVETFSTKVVMDGGGDIVAGEPATFRVTTNPPGFESEVLWMAGTLFGTAEPATGKGASFTAVFERPWPTTPDGIICMGVRAGTGAVIVEAVATFGDDMSRLSLDLADAEKEIGKRVCCMVDSTARAETYKGINALFKARDAINTALNVYNGLSKVTKKAIDIAYGNVEGDMRVQLNEIEVALAKLKQLPDCSSAALTKGVETLSFCTDLVDFLVGFATAIGILGLFLALVGVALVWIPGVGQPIALAGVLFGAASAALMLVAYIISLFC